MLNFSDKTIIGTTSFGASGGSALTNILEEFDCVAPLKGDATFECKFFSSVFFQLEIALKNQLYVNAAVKEFLYQVKLAAQNRSYIENFGVDYFTKLSYEYINSVTDYFLGGIYSERDYALIDSSEQQQFGKLNLVYNALNKSAYSLYEPYNWCPSCQPLTKQYFGTFDDDFYKKTQEYTSKLFAPIFGKKNYVVIDALFRPESVIHELNYFKNAKCTIVDRDPRDHYVMNKVYWGEPYLPTWSVDTYIKWFKTYRSCNKRNSEHSTQILQLRFEDLIYNYEASLEKIKKFFNLPDAAHTKKGQVFIPEKSKTNTQLFRKYPQYARDIEKIEKELSEFCYPYSETQIRHFSVEETKSAEKEPIEDIRKTIYIFQKTGKLPFSNIKGAFMFMRLFEEIRTFKNRRGIKSYVKGIIKIGIAMLFFPIGFIRSLIRLKRYQKKNKNKIIEFK